MKLYKSYILGATLLSGMMMMAGCTDDFEDLNTNPNKTVQVNPEYMFNSSIYSTLDTFEGDMKKRMGNYAEYFSGYINGHMQCYADETSSNDTYWKKIYTTVLLPLRFIDEQLTDKEEYHNRVLIADIWKSYIFSQLTAMYGPVPYTQALSGKPTIPYDDEPTIYYGLLDELKRCADGLDMDGDVFQKDAVYPTADGTTDLLKWKKFANSLRLRLAVRIANADPAKAREVIAELMADESTLLTSNADNCTITWGDNADTRNYFYDLLVINGTSNNDKKNSVAEAALMYTAPYHDPRCAVWFTECSMWTIPDDFHWAPYWGQPKTQSKLSGSDTDDTAHNGKTADLYSQLSDMFLAQDYSEVVMCYAELALLKSEILHKGYGSGSKTAREYYEEGVKASMEQWGVSAAAASQYLTVPGIEWNTLTDLNATDEGEAYYQDWMHIASSAITADDEDPIFRQIVMQQWLCLFYRPLDGWTLRRRTQVLDFVPHVNPTLSYGAVNAGNAKLTFAYLPHRMLYPSAERINNYEEMLKGVAMLENGANSLDTKLWFALPTKHNKYLDSMLALQ